MYTLGINAAYHDTSACLVEDGRVVAAAEDERFTRIKHGKRPVPFSAWELPYHAIDYCLAEAGIQLADVDHVAYAYDPYLLLDTRGGILVQPALRYSPNTTWSMEVFYNFLNGNLYGDDNENIMQTLEYADELGLRASYQF